jgi:hypothetical protein
MKRKIILSLIILTLSFQFSCNNWLELIPPQGLIRDEFWKTKEDVESVLMGAYSSFASMNDQLFKYGEIRGDMISGDISQSDDERKIMESSIYADNAFCNWQNFYRVINSCNEVITNAPVVQGKDKTFTDYILDGYLSEAYFLRSLCYFYLVRIYKDVPLILEPTLTDASEIYLPKTDGDAILTQIKTDLEQARSWATVDGYLTMDENKGRATKAAYDALLADIALWTFDYQTCIDHVQNIEASRKYKLMPQADWFNIFYPGNSYEGIFEFQFSDALNQPNKLFGLTNQSANNYVPSDHALEIFDEELSGEAVRGMGASIKRYGEGDYVIWKFIGLRPDGQTLRYGTVQNSCNWIVYRYADVLLMKAEALSQLGRFPEAQAIYNDIRLERGMPPKEITSTFSAFEDAILDERALELAFEGKRWFDLLRMGRRNNYSRKSKLIEKIVTNVPSTQKRILQTKLTNPLSWYLPIWENELERNKNLVQNPYYNF